MYVLESPWIPVIRNNGDQATVSVRDIITEPNATSLETRIHSIAFADDILNWATLELLTGVLQVLFTPDSESDWKDLQTTGISAECFDEIALAHREDFTLFGPRPFLQDHTVVASESKPIQSLMHAAPGENTRKMNKDFVGSSFDGISVGAAIAGLYAKHAYAPAGGSGLRTSLAGGGPFRTLPIRSLFLWQQAWGLVLPANVFWSFGKTPYTREELFPWLDPNVRPANIVTHPASHLYFGMPRRILLTPPNINDVAYCPFTGETGPVLRGFFEVNNGPEYSSGKWRHPLTPYVKIKKEGREDWAPILASRFDVGANWNERISMTLNHEGFSPAYIIQYWNEHSRSRKLLGAPYRLREYGIAFNNAAMRFTLESEESFPDLPDNTETDHTLDYQNLLYSAIQTSAKMADYLEECLCNVLYDGKESKGAGAKLAVSTYIQNFWTHTEECFYAYERNVRMGVLQASPDAKKQTEEQFSLRFMQEIQHVALGIFDRAALPRLLQFPGEVAGNRAFLHGICNTDSMRLLMKLPILNPEKERKPKTQRAAGTGRKTKSKSKTTSPSSSNP